MRFCCYGNLKFPLTYNRESENWPLLLFWPTVCRNVPWIVLFQTYQFCPNLWIWLVAVSNQMAKFEKKYSEIISSKAIREIQLKLCRNVHNISLYKKKKFFFYCHCSCTFSLLWQLKVSIYHKTPKNLDTRKFAVITLKVEQDGFTLGLCIQKMQRKLQTV